MLAINALVLFFFALENGKRLCEAANSEMQFQCGDETYIEGGPGTYPESEEDEIDRPSFLDSLHGTAGFLQALVALSGTNWFPSRPSGRNPTSTSLSAPVAEPVAEPETGTINLVTGPISIAEAIALSLDLCVHLDSLRSALTTIKTNEIAIAAARVRSFIPDYIIEDKKKKDENDDSDWSYIITPVPNSRSLFIDFLDKLVKKLPIETKSAALNEIERVKSMHG